ncbi:MAG: ParB N-terminal domain-containing protein [Lachnospiraceae bacterium]|nr:ParB N-terminal domain-containing protein [Lachnospiraceae bacterium]
MKIIDKPIDEIVPYEKNPRKNDKAVAYVANSIREFGFRVPVVVDKDGVIICGHTRVKAAKELGLDKVPCIAADDLTPEQVNALRLADNKTSEIAEWDLDLLDEELQGILDIDMSEFGFDLSDLSEEEMSHTDIYTKKMNIPQYEPTGDEVDLSDLVDTSKADTLIEEINLADISEEIKAFLREAAHRHSVFDYRNIAEFYAQAEPAVQMLMERSALVIIDIDDAIANGYARLTKRVQDLIAEEHGDEL